MSSTDTSVLIVGGGTSGAVLAARLSEVPSLSVTVLEAGPDDAVYDDALLDPARAADAWAGAAPIAPTPMLTPTGAIPMFQGRVLGGTSAINGLATLRGLPDDYDAWAASGLTGWGWADVVDTFVAAERDVDFPTSPLHGSDGPLPVRRWRRDELSAAQCAFQDGMVEIGQPAVADINDPSQLPGIGVFPVTIDEAGRRVSTSLAYLPPAVRARENLVIRTGTEVDRIEIEGGRARAVTLTSGETLEADEILLTAGALWSPWLLQRAGIGPAADLAAHGIPVHADLPVGRTLSDHLGPGIAYGHAGPRGGVAGPAQVLLIGASDGVHPDYHCFPIARAPGEADTQFMMAAFLLRSSNRGRVELGEDPAGPPRVTAPPLPDDARDTLKHAFARIAAWERSEAFAALGCAPLEPHDLTAPDAVDAALERLVLSYGHMTSTCPMGPVLDADCRVHRIAGLRVADASVMPTIPSGNTYLGCVMIAERVARKMKAERAPAA